MRHAILTILLALGSMTQSLAQGHLFSEVRIKPGTVFVGQPVEVTVAVYTSTWFTAGVNPGNIKVNGAFTVYFRSVSTSKSINGQTYAGVEMIFNVFPYDDEDVTFPSLSVAVETPDEGDYKGKKRVIKTSAKTINVKPVPPGLDRSRWLVAGNVQVSEQWSRSTNEIRVGEVLERKITQRVQGTVAELIQPIVWDSVGFVGVYPVRPQVSTQKSKTSISASRTDGVRYLFEKEGEVVIPEVVISWWNPAQKKLFKRTLKGITINVLPNPDLGMLTTVRDSLQVEADRVAGSEADDQAFSLFGLSLKQLVMLLVLVVIGVLVVIKAVIRIKNRAYVWYSAYRRSEAYYFKQFISQASKKDISKAQLSLYRWLDQLQLAEPTIYYFISHYGSEGMRRKYHGYTTANHAANNVKISYNIAEWKKARKNYKLKLRRGNTIVDENWINPLRQ
jgi:hypothetical protein